MRRVGIGEAYGRARDGGKRHSRVDGPWPVLGALRLLLQSPMLRHHDEDDRRREQQTVVGEEMELNRTSGIQVNGVDLTLPRWTKLDSSMSRTTSPPERESPSRGRRCT
jgi:hypothetical protein